MTHTIDMSHTQPQDQYITIIARTVADAMRQFKTRGLAEMGYAIVGPIDKHHFALADGEDQSTDLFEGNQMIAATFRRSTPQQG